ncbi:hypothetical protein [Dyella ginsengisoli]|uniref:hypothetical protein n=1 Tax=Dyella ginsengisoli TaxID=363848 RepID=UPI0012FDB1D5|nr:hypothetical protein [Dyella ginsengisoli]
MLSISGVLADHGEAIKKIERDAAEKRAFFVNYLEKYRDEIVSRFPRCNATRLNFPRPIPGEGDLEIGFTYLPRPEVDTEAYVWIRWSERSPNLVKIVGSMGSEQVKPVSLFKGACVDIVGFVAEVLRDDLILLRRSMSL